MSSCSRRVECRRASPVMRYLSADSGQALLEAPVVILLTVMLVLILLQPAVWLYTKALLNGAAGAACRVAATDDYTFGGGKQNHDLTIQNWVIDRKLSSLPKAELFQASSPEVDVKGDIHDWVTVRVSVRQKPLPLIGTLFAKATVGLDADGMVTIVSTARVPGAMRGIAGTQDAASGVYGQDVKPK